MENLHTSIFFKEKYFRKIYGLLLLPLMLLVILFPEVSCAQVIAGKEFKPRTSQLTTPVGQSVYNVKGNFAMVGNTNLTLQNYSDTRVNGGNAMIYVDVDGDANTINSSSATLSFSNENGADPSCSNVVYAGLYWTGRAHNSGNSPMEFTVGEVTTDLNNGNSMSGYTLSMVAVNEDQGAGTSDGRLATYTFTPTGGGQVVVFRFRSWYEGSFWPTYKGTMTVQVGAGTETPLNGSLVNTSSNNYTFNFDNAYPIGTGNQSFKINSIRKRRTDNGINANYRVSVTKEGKLLNKRQVQFKKAGGSYQPIIANANDIYYPDNTHGNMYSAYADVTDIVKAGGQGEYFVADMALTAGTGDGTGYYGGWGLVVVYENSKMKWRDITVFDGHAYMSANGNNQTLDVSGFQSVQTGDVGVKIGMMAGEGDQEYTGDAFDIRSSSSSNANPSWKELLNQAGQTNNFFNSRIVGVPNRNPNLTNNSGVDIKVMELNNSDKSYITNNQTSTRFRYRTDGDTYIIFNIVFAVDAYVPEVQPVNSVITVNGNPYVPGSLVSPGDEIGYKLEVKNLGTEAINNAKVRIPVPYTAANYVVGSAIGQRHVATGSTATPFFNPIDGSLGAINWDIGTLPLPSNSNDILATLTYKFKVTEDCFLLSNPICTPTLAVTGTVSGTGATTNASLGNSGTFISGFQNAGACVGEPIHDPVKLGIAVGDRCKDYEYEARNFSICDGSTPQNILATVRAGFPSGTRFYSAVDAEGKGTGTEYNDTTPFPTNAPNATYYAIPPGAAGCYFEFKLKVIIVNTPPTTGSTDPLKYCVGETAVPLVATASSTSYNLYYYRGIDGNGNPTGVAETSITPSTSTAGTFEYYVTQGTADCQSPVSKITVIISAPPVISEPIENLILCEGSTGSVSVTAPGNNLTYTWEYYNGTAWVVLPNGTQDKITVSGNILTLTGASLAYNGGKVRVKVSNGKCSVVSEEALITINALPVVSAITGPNAVCIGSTVALSSTPTGGVWSSSNTSVATVSNTGVVTGVSAGTVTIRYTVTNGSGCSTVVTKDITVNALPVVSAITGSNSVCIGSTVALSSTPTGGVWSSSNTSVATVSTSGVVTGVSAGTVTISYSVTNGSGCSTVVTKDVTVIPLPSTPNTTNTSTYVGAPGIAYDATANPGHTLVWYSDEEGTSIIPKPSVSTAAQGTFIAYVAQQNDVTGCISEIVSVLVTVKPVRVEVTKTVDQDNINAPKVLKYEIKVKNTGEFNLSNVQVLDELEQSGVNNNIPLVIGSAVQTGGIPNNNILEIGETWTYKFEYTVSQSQIDNGNTLINHVSVISTEMPEPTVDIATTTITRNAGISITKKHNLGTSNDCFGLKVNDKITYTFTVKNTGNVSLNSLNVTSTLSPRLGNITSTGQGALLPGATREFTAEYIIDQVDINRGFISGSAKVVANTPAGQITGAVGGKVEIPSDEVKVAICQTGKVSIEKTVDKQEVSRVGEELTYTIKVTNTGNIDLEDVTVEDAMLGLNEVIDLMVGEVKTYTLKYVVTYNDLLKKSLDNIASATLKTNEKVTDETSTSVKFDPEISIVKSADKSEITFLGELIEYTIEVTNTGTVDLVSVVVTDPMFPSFTGSVGNLAIGETRKIDLTYESVLADIIRGEITNTARVEGTVGGVTRLRSFNPTTGVIEKLSNEVLVKVVFNNVLEVTKDADKTEVNKEGEVITYTIKVANKGNYDLTDVVVKDPLTGMMETIGNMAIGAEKTFKTTYKVRRSDFDNGSIVNEVIATGKDLAGGHLEGRAERIVGIARMPFFIPNVFTPNDDGTNDTFEIEGIEAFDRTEVIILNRWGNEVYRNNNYRNEWTGQGLNEGTYFYIVKTIKGTKEDLYKGHVLIKTR